MNFTLKQLSYFLAAAEHQSTTAAAAALNVSQPSVSAAIAQLEAGLGGPLFTRHQGIGLSMTPMGRRAMKSARAILTQAADFNPGLLGTDRALVGEVELACFGDLFSAVSGADRPELTLGRAVARGHSPEVALEQAGGSIEGIEVARRVAAFAELRELHAPLARVIAALVDGVITPKEAVGKLMGGGPGSEE